MTMRAKVISLNILFHFGVLGFIVKPIFYPNMANEEWLLGLLVMVFLMNPIAAYFFGWEMRLKGYVSADAPKYQRLSLLFLLMAVYSLIFLKWLGAIGQISVSN